MYRRLVTTGDLDRGATEQVLAQADTDPDEAEAIYQLTAIALAGKRFVIPPMHREEAIETLGEPLAEKGETGMGFRTVPERGA